LRHMKPTKAISSEIHTAITRLSTNIFPFAIISQISNVKCQLSTVNSEQHLLSLMYVRSAFGDNRLAGFGTGEDNGTLAVA